MAKAQGPDRHARGLAYVQYLRQRHPELKPQVHEIPDVGHDAEKMLTSACGLKALFDKPGCQPAP